MITEIPIFDTLQDNIVQVLKDQADEDAAFNPGYNFEVYSDRSVPFTGSKSRVVVNVSLPKIDPVSQKSAYRNFITQNCLFGINFFVEAVETELEKSDIIVTKRRFLLAAQIINALTNNKNVNLGLKKIDININLQVEFQDKINDRTSSSIVAPGNIIFMAEIPFKTADLENLPELTTLQLDVSGIWKTIFNY
jgi:hypothetical protein